MTTHILLTGAGFSRNWGGWLANECFEYLLGCAELTPFIQQQLWRSKNSGLGFENTLQALRDINLVHKDDTQLTAELHTFERMLEGMFSVMTSSFASVPFEPGREEMTVNPVPEFIRNFLCRFDAIFTLNQDTLLEQRYAPLNIRQGSQGKWFGMDTPGMETITLNGAPYAPPGLFTPSKNAFKPRERYQPYFKLHGSSNWRADSASALLVMGESKQSDLDKVPILAWYRGEFFRMLREPDTRLMVIGYGFQDIHINNIIEQSAPAGLKLFIIDPEGVDVLDHAKSSDASIGAFKHKVWQNIIGGSRRNLIDTVTKDVVERAKVLHFFAWP